jgi:hypothetical protein
MTDDINNNDNNMDELLDEGNLIQFEKSEEGTITKVRVPGGNVRQINFGKDFEDWDDQKKIRYLKSLASSMNQAAEFMQDERNKVLRNRDMILKQLQSCENSLMIQKNIVAKSIKDFNQEREKFIKHVQELTATVKAREDAIRVLEDKLSLKNSK